MLGGGGDIWEETEGLWVSEMAGASMGLAPEGVDGWFGPVPAVEPDLDADCD